MIAVHLYMLVTLACCLNGQTVVIECVAQIAVPDRQGIDFCSIHIAKAKLQYNGWAALMSFQVNSFPSWGHLRGYQRPDTWIFNHFFVPNLCIFMTDVVFKMCTNPFLVNCSQRQLQIDLVMILREGRRGDEAGVGRDVWRTIGK